MKNYKVLFFSAAMFITANAWAVQVTSCDAAGVKITHIEPGSEATFYSKQVSAFLTNKVEPSASAMGIAINVPGNSTEGEGDGPYCFAIAHLHAIDWENRVSSYDPDKGVLIEVSATRVTGQGSDENLNLKIRINRDGPKPTVTLE